MMLQCVWLLLVVVQSQQEIGQHPLGIPTTDESMSSLLPPTAGPAAAAGDETAEPGGDIVTPAAGINSTDVPGVAVVSAPVVPAADTASATSPNTMPGITTGRRRTKHRRHRPGPPSTVDGHDGPLSSYSEGNVEANAAAVGVAAITWNGDVGTGCDFKGQDMRSVTIATILQCMVRCNNTIGCTHFVWSKFNGGTCFMKNGARAKTDAIVSSDSTMMCGLMLKWNGKNWANGCDFRGRDLQQARVPVEQCNQTCARTTSCTHYTWTTFNGGTCFMKQGVVSKLDAFVTGNNSMVCGVVVNWNGKNWANACDFLGRDLQQAKVPVEQCGPTCARTTSCTHYTWTTFNGGTCFMKQGPVSKLDALVTTDNSMVCGVVVNWNGNNWANACDFLGRDLQQARVPAEQCGPTCARTTSCTHYTWTTFNGGTCFMKQGVVSKLDALVTTDNSMVCGIADTIPPPPGRQLMRGISHANQSAFNQQYQSICYIHLYKRTVIHT
jgi:hypothetical protein